MNFCLSLSRRTYVENGESRLKREQCVRRVYETRHIGVIDIVGTRFKLNLRFTEESRYYGTDSSRENKTAGTRYECSQETKINRDGRELWIEIPGTMNEIIKFAGERDRYRR